MSMFGSYDSPGYNTYATPPSPPTMRQNVDFANPSNIQIQQTAALQDSQEIQPSFQTPSCTTITSIFNCVFNRGRNENA